MALRNTYKDTVQLLKVPGPLATLLSQIAALIAARDLTTSEVTHPTSSSHTLRLDDKIAEAIMSRGDVEAARFVANAMPEAAKVLALRLTGSTITPSFVERLGLRNQQAQRRALMNELIEQKPKVCEGLFKEVIERSMIHKSWGYGYNVDTEMAQRFGNWVLELDERGARIIAGEWVEAHRAEVAGGGRREEATNAWKAQPGEYKKALQRLANAHALSVGGESTDTPAI